MDKAQHSRRAVLGAAITIPAVAAMGGGAAFATAKASESAAIDRGAWDHVFSAMLRAKAAADVDDRRHKPIWEAYRSACDAIPHTSVTALTVDGNNRDLSTARYEDVSFAAGVARARPTDNAPLSVACRNLLGAVEAREAEKRRISDRLGYHASAEVAEKLSEGFLDQCSALMGMSAPDAPALLWKLEHLFGDEVGLDEHGDGFCSSYSTRWMRLVMEDARRVLGREA
jgi:hypothetical protein